MLKAILKLVALSESNETPLLVILILSNWNDTPWNSASIRDKSNMSTLIHIPTGHMRFVPAHRRSDDMTATLPPDKCSVELVLILNAADSENYLDE